MDLALGGKTAVVTGACKGTGLALARALVDHGVQVVAASRSRTESLEKLTSRPEVVHEGVDLGTALGPARVVERALSEFGGLDILVNNVGVSLPRDGFLSLTDEDWDSSWRVNFLSAGRRGRGRGDREEGPGDARHHGGTVRRARRTLWPGTPVGLGSGGHDDRR